MSSGEGIAAELTEAADRYPCSLQVYGEAVWHAMASSGKRRLGPDQARKAVGQGDEGRRLRKHERH